MKALIIKYNRTKEQDAKLMQMALSPYTSSIKSRACLKNANLLVKQTDERGREFFREMTRTGELKPTYQSF